MRSRICANLGFLMQITGLLTILPIGIGFVYNETQNLVPLFLACVTFLGCGFLLNSLCERKDLNFKSSNILLITAFILLPLIGALPYIYSDPFHSANLADRFTNGYFESISGFTTTGFSFITNPDVLPRSLLVYRSLTELMGGIGVVFLLLAFFQSRKSLNNLGNALGIDNLNGNLKKTFYSVFAIYGIYIIAFIIFFSLLGFTDVLKTGTFVVDTITGGFQASAPEFQRYMGLLPRILILILMTAGSVNFAFNYHLFTGKLKKLFSAEIAVFFLIIALGTIAISAAANVGLFDSLFHVVSMSSSTGYDYINIPSLNSTALSIFILLMIVGGCSFSMAGGIRISKLIAFAKSVKQAVKGVFIKEENGAEHAKGTEPNYFENLPVLISILLLLFTLVIFAILFTTMGVSFTDALFEVGSAITTNGISMGATSVTMPLTHKWLMIAAMTIGRVEILTIILALFPYKTKKE